MTKIHPRCKFTPRVYICTGVYIVHMNEALEACALFMTIQVPTGENWFRISWKRKLWWSSLTDLSLCDVCSKMIKIIPWLQELLPFVHKNICHFAFACENMRFLDRVSCSLGTYLVYIIYI